MGAALDGVPILGLYHPKSGAMLLSPEHDSSSPPDECHHPGVLLGFAGAKGKPCVSVADREVPPGCPDHKMFSRVTRRAQMFGRRLARHGCPAAAAAAVAARQREAAARARPAAAVDAAAAVEQWS